MGCLLLTVVIALCGYTGYAIVFTAITLSAAVNVPLRGGSSERRDRGRKRGFL